jgi:pyruvate dehydrogenase E2 component (dihydrolipoamide acetyltransferase)
MAIEITMPKLWLTMDEGTINNWFVKEGQYVEAGKPLLTVETDKVAIDVESPADGVLLKILIKEGQTVPISTLIGYIGEPGEVLPVQKENVKVSPTVQPEVKENILRLDVTKTARSEAPVQISPLAKKLAVEHEIDYHSIKGTGPGGRIIEDDVRKAISSLTQESYTIPFKFEPLSPIKKITAERMSMSFHSAPHFYLRRQIHMDKLVEIKENFDDKASEGSSQKLTYTDLLIKGIAKALLTHPYLNASWSDDGIRIFQRINIGFAIASTRGLLVTVIKDADAKSLSDISEERALLVKKASEDQLSEEDINGGTFTLTNLGMYDVDDFSPILNPPQCGIMAVGKISEQPVAEDHQIQLRKIMNVTLAADHRVVDGVEASKFLATFAEMIEKEPEKLI